MKRDTMITMDSLPTRFYSSKRMTPLWKRMSRKVVLGASVLLLLIAGYVLLLLVAPQMYSSLPEDQAALRTTPTPCPEGAPTCSEESSPPSGPIKNQIMISKIGVQEVILEGGPEKLDEGVWHKYPERGEPTKGNFILTAHRFVFGLTPTTVRHKSPFFNIHKLVAGDTITIWWNEQQYVYTITRIYSVDPYALQVESPSEKPKLTLYTCTLQGEDDGRVVIEAELKK